MSRFSFDLARETDDIALQKMLSDNPMPGEISIAFQRNPSYFAGTGVHGPFHQTIIVRDQVTGEAAGCITRAVKPVFVNGEVKDIGYLSSLQRVPNIVILNTVAGSMLLAGRMETTFTMAWTAGCPTWKSAPCDKGSMS